jgi:hypothetical protein
LLAYILSSAVQSFAFFAEKTRLDDFDIQPRFVNIVSGLYEGQR